VRLEVWPAARLDAEARSGIIALCEAAYAEPFPRLFEQMPGSVHILARDEHGALVAHAEWITRWLQPAGLPPLRTAYVEMVATVPSARGRGLGRAVMRRALEAIESEPPWELAALCPSAPEFYERLGWQRWRGPLAIRKREALEPTPDDEVVMIRRLAGTPATLDDTSLLTAEWREGEPW